MSNSGVEIDGNCGHMHVQEIAYIQHYQMVPSINTVDFYGG